MATDLSGSLTKERGKRVKDNKSTSEMEEGELSGMSIDDKMVRLIREMRIGKELQNK